MNSCVRARDSFLQPEWSRRKYEVLERYAPSVVRRLAPLPLQKHHRPCGHGRYRMQSRMNCAFSARLMWCRFPGRFLQRRCPHLRGLRRRSRRRYMTCAFRAESSGGRRAPSPKFQPSSAVGTTALQHTSIVGTRSLQNTFLAETMNSRQHAPQKIRRIALLM